MSLKNRDSHGLGKSENRRKPHFKNVENKSHKSMGILIMNIQSVDTLEIIGQNHWTEIVNKNGLKKTFNFFQKIRNIFKSHGN